MSMWRARGVLVVGALLAHGFVIPELHAGGSGFNVAVVVNQASSNSVELGNYYCEQRQIPPENLLRINWSGGNTLWTNADFQTNLLAPLLEMLSNRGLTNQIEYVVLSMDIPFQTANTDVVNGTSSALFYGLKTETGPAWVNISNSYYASEIPFTWNKPASASGPSFLTTLITSDSIEAAKRLVDRGVASDGTFPMSSVILAKTSDPARNFRFNFFDNAVFNVRLAGRPMILRTNLDSFYGLTNVMGLELGLTQFGISPNSFVPGAIADNVTSFGGIIFGPNDQTTALTLINAGACGSYGTVTEPSPVAEKFPDPQVYFYQARGFNIAEAYYQSVFEPYEGIIVGESLAAPFAQQGNGAWLNVTSNAVLSGNVPLTVRFTAADATHPLQRVDLFVDGRFFKTLTNISPSAGNVIKLGLNGYPFTYTVPADATIESVASNLVNLINAPAATNAAKAFAVLHGDRIELHSLATNRPNPPRRLRPRAAIPDKPLAGVPLSITNLAGAAQTATTFLHASRGMFLNSTAAGNKVFTVGGSVQVGSWLSLTVTKTNGTVATINFTNQAIGAMPYDLAAGLVGAINSNALFQRPDGLFAEDLRAGFFGAGSFTLRSGSPGLVGAGTRVLLKGASNMVVSATNQVSLNDNLLDTQPRNHLYVTAGLTNVTVDFTLNTTSLADGFHELTAVAYEGSHVRTQTRSTIAIILQNTTFNATLIPQDFGPSNSVQGTYHVQVSANATNVAMIQLFSTGGELAAAANQSNVSLTVNAANLGAGGHPLYALVETITGERFRTKPLWVRFGY
jgi:uncharacterized protein (TIGR03790 family)